jgi:hypothetical protein
MEAARANVSARGEPLHLFIDQTLTEAHCHRPRLSVCPPTVPACYVPVPVPVPISPQRESPARPRANPRGPIRFNVPPHRIERKAKRAARDDTFEAIALEWLQVQEKSLSARTFRKKKDRLSTFELGNVGQTLMQAGGHAEARSRDIYDGVTPTVRQRASRCGDADDQCSGARGDGFSGRHLRQTEVDRRLVEPQLYKTGFRRPVAQPESGFRVLRIFS